jgi:preprotein translocase subunit SecB
MKRFNFKGIIMAKKTKTENPASNAADTSDPIIINAQFIRDLSFEAPSMPAVLKQLQEAPPNIHIDVNVNTKQYEETVFEVILNINAKAKAGDEIAFILELEYCGVFTINCEPEAIKPMALIECPRILFPFARSILAQVTRDAGFPPLMLGMVDFAKMFKEEMNRVGAVKKD